MSSSARSTAQHPVGLRRDLGKLSMLFIGVGATVGSGWLFGAMIAAQLAGPAALISWVIGAVMIGLIALVYAELGPMFPLSGAAVRIPHFSHGGLTSFSVGWISWLVVVCLGPIEVEAVLQYATSYIPFLTHLTDGVPVLTVRGYVVAAALLLIFCLVNLLGVRAFARTNNVITWWKIAIIMLFVIAIAVTAFHPGHFSNFGGFAPNGTHGIFTAVATAGIAFSFFGFRQGIEMAGESRNPQRAVPLSILGTLVITLILYLLVQFVFLGAIPTSELGQGWANLELTSNQFAPLASLASAVGLVWLAGVLYADAVISPAGSGLIYATISSRVSYGMGRVGTAPQGLTRTSARGVPWISVTLTFIVGLVVFLPFPSWQKLAAFLTAANGISLGSGPVVLLALRRQLPDYRRPFRLPAAPVVCFLAFFASNLLIYWAGWDTDWKLFIAIGIGYVLYALHVGRNRDQVRYLHPRAFSWIIGWVVGLIVICALGTFGGTGLLHAAAAYPLLAVFSAFILWWGVAVRLPIQRVNELIELTGQDDGDMAVETTVA